MLYCENIKLYTPTFEKQKKKILFQYTSLFRKYYNTFSASPLGWPNKEVYRFARTKRETIRQERPLVCVFFDCTHVIRRPCWCQNNRKIKLKFYIIESLSKDDGYGYGKVTKQEYYWLKKKKYSCCTCNTNFRPYSTKQRREITKF